MNKFQYNKILKQYRLFLARDGNRSFHEEDISELENLIASPVTQVNALHIGSSLRGMASWYARAAISNIDQRGESAGWQVLANMAALYYFDDRIRLLCYERTEDKDAAQNWMPSIYSVRQSVLACFALAQKAEGAWLSARLEASRSDGSIEPWEWPYPSARLAIALGRVLRSNTAASEMDDLELGVYGHVFECWNDPSRLRGALHEAADYHVANIESDDEDYHAEFGRQPFDVFPGEIIAIHRVRRWLGMETPEIDHPLMQTPVAKVPNQLPIPNDPYLARAIAKVREIFPEM